MSDECSLHVARLDSNPTYKLINDIIANSQRPSDEVDSFSEAVGLLEMLATGDANKDNSKLYNIDAMKVMIQTMHACPEIYPLSDTYFTAFYCKLPMFNNMELRSKLISSFEDDSKTLEWYRDVLKQYDDAVIMT